MHGVTQRTYPPVLLYPEASLLTPLHKQGN